MALENETGHQVFGRCWTVRFENKCADAIPHQVHAYAELRSEEGSARALVLVYARRGALRGQEMFVGARLVAMRLEAAVAGANWSVSLEAHTAGGRYVGVKHSHYICCPSREREGDGRSGPTAPGCWSGSTVRSHSAGNGAARTPVTAPPRWRRLPPFSG